MRARGEAGEEEKERRVGVDFVIVGRRRVVEVVEGERVERREVRKDIIRCWFLSLFGWVLLGGGWLKQAGRVYYCWMLFDVVVERREVATDYAILERG